MHVEAGAPTPAADCCGPLADSGHLCSARRPTPSPSPSATPAAAVRLASAVLARRGTEPALRVRARLALGRAGWARRDAATAVRHLRRAAADADRLGLHADAAQARLTLAAALADSGRAAAAVRVLGAAAPHLDGIDGARAAGQRAYLLHLQGRLPEALEGYLDVLERFRRLDDPLRQAVTLLNLAVVHTHQGLLARAAGELTAAHRLFERAGEPLRAAHAAANLGWVLARQGRVPEALRWFDRAEHGEAGDGGVARLDPQTGKDRAEALLAARLLPEAREAAALAEREFERLGMRGPVAECRLLAARASLLLGEHDAAREQAEAAERAAGDGRPALRALAQHLRLQAVLAGSGAGSGCAGCPLAGSRAAWRRPVGWSTRRRRTSPPHRSPWRWADPPSPATSSPPLGHESAAALCSCGSPPGTPGPCFAWPRGTVRGARAALRAGVRVLDRHRAALGATELRALATGHGLPLLRLGAGLALEAGDAWDALAWTERGRSAGRAGSFPSRCRRRSRRSARRAAAVRGRGRDRSDVRRRPAACVRPAGRPRAGRAQPQPHCRRHSRRARTAIRASPPSCPRRSGTRCSSSCSSTRGACTPSWSRGTSAGAAAAGVGGRPRWSGSDPPA